MTRKLLLTGTLLAVFLLTAVSPGNSQLAGDVPPHVIDVWPLPGVEMAQNEPLSVTFSQPMNQKSVEQSLYFRPGIAATYRWSDSRTLLITPTSNWPIGKNYTVSIGNGARAANGLRLPESYHIDVKTVGTLEVGEITPAKDARRVSSTSRIIVSFNRPVIALGTSAKEQPVPVVLSPEVEGKGEWINTSVYAFTPSVALAGGTSYTAKISAGLTSVDGAVLANEYIWSFITQGPRVISIVPGVQGDDPYEPNYYYYWNPARRNEKITVTFNQPMDRASTQAAFSLTTDKNIARRGTFTWNSGSTVLTFTPESLLDFDTQYSVEIAPTAEGANGGTRIEAFPRHRFTTQPRPGVKEVSPNGANRLICTHCFPMITFRSEMDMEKLKDSVVISPDPGGWKLGSDGREVWIYMNTKADTQYTITIKAGAVDTSGEKLEQDYSWSFKTGSRPDWASVVRPWGHFFRRPMTMSGYGTDILLPMAISGKPNVSFKLYSVLLSDMATAFEREEFGRSTPASATKENLVREWDQSFDSGPQINTSQKVKLTLANGQKLPPGQYWLTATSIAPADVYTRNPDRLITEELPLAVINANITVKRTPDEAFLWVTDLQTTAPLADTAITVYRGGKILIVGRTNAQGVYRFPLASLAWTEVVTIKAESQGVFGLWTTFGTPDQPDTQQVYVYTDRPIYRPGETVHFRAILRERHDTTLSAPRLKTAQIEISTYIGYEPKKVFTAELPLTEYGTLSGEYKIPENIELGSATLTIKYGDHSHENYQFYDPLNPNLYDQLADKRLFPPSSSIDFTIAEYRTPEFEVKVDSVANMIQGEALSAIVRANYYAGGNVGGADVDVAAYGCPTQFRYKGSGNYQFDNEDWQEYRQFYYSNHQYRGTYYRGEPTCMRFIQELGIDTRQKGTTDDRGTFPLTFQYTKFQEGNGPMLIAVDATVKDQSGQSISGQAVVTAHPANVYVGLHLTNKYLFSLQPVNVELLTVNADSKWLAKQPFELSLVEMQWERTRVPGKYEWNEKATIVERVQLSSDEQGKASYTFRPPYPGRFRIQATAKDEKGRASTTVARFWIFGASNKSWNPQNQPLTMHADKASYKPGDTAQIFIPLPFKGQSSVLVSVERASILSYEVVRVDGPMLLYKLPITAAQAPKIYLNVLALHGVDANSSHPDFVVGNLEITVEPVDRRLNIKLKASQQQAKPGDNVRFDVDITDQNGKGVQAEVGLKLTDKAILSLMADNSYSLEEVFYSNSGHYVWTDTAMSTLIDRAEYTVDEPCWSCGHGGGGEPPSNALHEPPIRTNFQQTPLWSPHVITDENGRATVSVTMPDNLTTWQLDARAVTLNTNIGQSTGEIVATLPLMVRPVTSRFFVAGDRVQLAAVVHNNTDTPQKAEVTLKAQGVDSKDPLTQTVTIPALSVQRVNWLVTVQDVLNVDLTFQAVSDKGLGDAVKPMLATGPNNTIPVYRYNGISTISTAGFLTKEGSKFEGVSLPPRLNPNGGYLNIRIDPSLAGAATDAFSYLRQYPYYCIEQTVSRFLPNIGTYRALRNLGIADPALEANLKAALNDALTKLQKEQKEEGGWGWYPNMSIDPLTSAYAALALIELREAGFQVDPQMLKRAVGYVMFRAKYPSGQTASLPFNQHAFFWYVAARAHLLDPNDLKTLYGSRSSLSYAARAFLLLAYAEVDPKNSAIRVLASDLRSAAIQSSSGAHWKETQADWENWGTDTRTTAIVLKALLRVTPNSPLLPEIVRWLMSKRQDDHWNTTQETAWTVMAFTDWMVYTGELKGNYDFSVNLNREVLKQTSVSPETIRQSQTVRVAVSDLLQDQLNKVIIVRGKGRGALYYTTSLDLRLPPAEAKSISRGISIQRQYLVGGKPVDTVKIGDIVDVKLTVTVMQSARYLALEDPFPAGLEAVDTALATTTRGAKRPSFDIADDSVYRYWGWWWFGHSELRDQQANFYADYIPSGTYVYTYQLRATVAGSFQVMPSRSYPFYQPEVFGQGDGLLFTVIP